MPKENCIESYCSSIEGGMLCVPLSLVQQAQQRIPQTTEPNVIYASTPLELLYLLYALYMCIYIYINSTYMCTILAVCTTF